VAKELHLDWKTVKSLEMIYMQAKWEKHGEINPEIIGIDEISMGHGHNYWIVVSDLVKRTPIWFSGPDRSEQSLDAFYESLPAEKRKKIRLAVMDMWKPFEKSTRKNIPEAAILYDKFHILRHLGNAMDQIRKEEYQRASKNDKKYIKGQKYTLLSHRENLSKKGRVALKELLAINRRLNTAYILKESFGQLWDYKTEGWARRFFENWKSSLKWQRLKPFEKFSELIERHWDGIEAFCKSENKVSLGFVEGLNNKIRTIQKRAYGLRDPEYIRLKILTCKLPEIIPN
jgi:transposase